MEELDLRLLLLGQELDVVDEQHVVVAVGLLEALDAALLGDRVDEVVGEALDGDVLAPAGDGCLCEICVGDRLHEVGLAEAGIGVDEDGVVGAAGDSATLRATAVGVLVVRADDEAVEDVARVEVGRGARWAPVGRDGGRAAARPVGGTGVERLASPASDGPAGASPSAAARSSTTMLRRDRVAEDLGERVADPVAKRFSIQSRAKSLGTPRTKTPSSRSSGSVRSNQSRKVALVHCAAQLARAPRSR